MVPWDDQQSVILIFPDHTHFVLLVMKRCLHPGSAMVLLTLNRRPVRHLTRCLLWTCGVLTKSFLVHFNEEFIHLTQLHISIFIDILKRNVQATTYVTFQY